VRGTGPLRRIGVWIYAVAVAQLAGIALAVWVDDRAKEPPWQADKVRRAESAVDLILDLENLGLGEILGDKVPAALSADVTFHDEAGNYLSGPGTARKEPPPTASERYGLAQGPVVRRNPFRVLVPLADGAYAVYRPWPRQRYSLSHWTLLTGGVLVFVLLSSLIFGHYLARPLERLATAARAFGSGHLDARVGPIRSLTEYGQLARNFDEMADRIADLMRSQKELLANVSHELRTPLARIRLALDLADGGDPAAARESLRDIAGDLAELERLVEDVLTTSRLDLAQGRAGETTPLRREPVEIPALLDRAASRMRAAHPGREVRVERDGEGPVISADPALLRRALDNLLDNAALHSEADRPIVLAARGDETGWALAVIDRGVGMSPQDQARLFTPFYRSDRSRSRATGGLGLGLVLARRIVEAHGGTLEIESKLGEGTTARIHLPWPGAAAVTVPPGAPPGTRPGATPPAATATGPRARRSG
jgi:two-component system OmpR family sensor kinase